jgi:hypothetical protein
VASKDGKRMKLWFKWYAANSTVLFAVLMKGSVQFEISGFHTQYVENKMS